MLPFRVLVVLIFLSVVSATVYDFPKREPKFGYKAPLLTWKNRDWVQK